MGTELDIAEEPVLDSPSATADGRRLERLTDDPLVYVYTTTLLPGQKPDKARLPADTAAIPYEL